MKTELTEKKIQDALFSRFRPGPYLFHLCNTFVFRFDWESDFYFQSRSGIHIEIEIKISRADFKKDLLKVRKHKILDLVTNKGAQLIPFPHRHPHPFGDDEEYWAKQPLTGQSNSINWFDITKNPVPNKFYYAAPPGLIKISEIPDYAGLIEVDENSSTIVKKAPIIHKNKYDLNRIIMTKYYWKYVNNRFNIDTAALEIEDLKNGNS